MIKIKRILVFSFIALVISLGLTAPIDSLTNNFKASGDVIFIKINFNNAYVCGESSTNDDLKYGDLILNINNKVVDIDTIENFENQKGNLDIEVLRDNSVTTISIKGTELKTYDFDDIYQGTATITAIDDENNFIGLSHGLKIGGNKISRNITKSFEIYDVDKVNYVPNQKRDIGHVTCYPTNTKIGEVSNTNESGIYGKLNKQFVSDNYSNLNIGIGVEKAKPGKAYVLLTNPETKKIEKYDCLILGVSVDGQFKIKLKDKGINKYSNGIVLGMSGSPIIQNGKLVGGVSGVIRDNTKTGFGLDVSRMVNLSND